MMSIYLSRSFPRYNSSFFLCSGNALQSEVLRLREEMLLVDAGPGTPRICMQDEPTGVPINRATRFENKGGSLDVVAGESLIKKRIFITNDGCRLRIEHVRCLALVSFAGDCK